MTDETTQPTPEAPAATPPPAAPAPAAPPAITPEVEALLNERIAGVQRSFQEQINQRDAIINQLKTATLSEDERAQLEQDERDEELESLRTQLWLTEQSKKNAKAAEAYAKILEADDPEKAFAVFEALVTAQTPAAPPAPEPETLVPDVDPNNPSIHSTNEATIRLPDGRVITEAEADTILKNMTHWPTN